MSTGGAEKGSPEEEKMGAVKGRPGRKPNQVEPQDRRIRLVIRKCLEGQIVDGEWKTLIAHAEEQQTGRPVTLVYMTLVYNPEPRFAPGETVLAQGIHLRSKGMFISHTCPCRITGREDPEEEEEE